MSETTSTPNGLPSAEQVSTTVVTAIADHKNVDPTELPPLYNTLDPEALDKLFNPNHSGVARLPGQVSFTIAGCDVVVDGDANVSVTSAASGSETELVE